MVHKKQTSENSLPPSVHAGLKDYGKNIENGKSKFLDYSKNTNKNVTIKIAVQIKKLLKLFFNSLLITGFSSYS